MMRRGNARRLFALVAAAAIAVGSVEAQQPSDQVELRGDLVEVRAVVTDKSGRIRDDLTKGDFEIRENGSPRDVAFFSLERVGAASAAPTSSATPGSGPAPAVGAAAAATPRTVVLFVDAANMPAGSVTRAKRALKTFVGARTADLGRATVVSSGGALGLEGRFTTSTAELGAAIDKISPRPVSFAGGAFTPYLAAEIVRGTNPEAIAAGAYLVRAEDGVPPPMDPDAPSGNETAPRLQALARQKATQVLAEAAEQRRRSLASLRAAVERLAAEPGQRLLMLVSDGFTLFDSGGDRDTAELKAVIARAVRSGVVISSLSGAGLESGTFSGSDDPLYAVPSPTFAGYGSASRRDLEDGVTALAKDTGGEVYRNTNDFGAALGKVLDANGIYYVLAFYPEGGDASRSRTIDVRLKSHPDLEVRAQRGSEAPPAQDDALATTPVVRALAADAPATDIGVVARAELAGTTNDGALATLNVYVDGAALDYHDAGDRKSFDLEVATAVLDEHGARTDTKVESLAGRLAPRAVDLARTNGFHVTRYATLAPGRYRLRVAVREPASGRLGTTTVAFEIPDLAAGRLALAGLALSGSHSAEGAPFVPRAPKGLRTYAASDFLIYTASVLGGGDPSALKLRIAILQGDRVLFRSAWDPLATRVVDRSGGAIRLSGQLQLGATPAGAYTLRVEVQDPARGQTSYQTADFGVER